MRKFVAAAAISAATAATPADMWKKYKEDYGIAFNGQGEDDKRFGIFKSNLQVIEKTNAKKLGYELGINQFTHLTSDEFAAQYTGLKKPKPARVWGDLPYLGRHNYTGAALADSVDWTQKGAVTPVKNQGQCGSCWSFSTTGSLEGAWQIATGNLVAFSEQQFVDCDKVDHGCDGGLMDDAIMFAEKNAICTEDSYAYAARRGTCKASSCTVGLPKGAVTGFKDVDKDDEKALMEALAKNPVSIAIEADKQVFQMYKSGILSGSECGTKLDHGVLAVGYGTDGGKDYWKVKNSWGPSWGDHGYIRLARGVSGAGECGILSDPSYPVVSGKPGPAPPSPPSPPAPPSPGTTHYEKPPCQDGEMAGGIQGADGKACFPKCDGESCPADVPAGTTATPKCVLEDSSSGDKYCALSCSFMSKCPPGSKCSALFSSGICLYPDAAAANADSKKLRRRHAEITV